MLLVSCSTCWVQEWDKIIVCAATAVQKFFKYNFTIFPPFWKKKIKSSVLNNICMQKKYIYSFAIAPVSVCTELFLKNSGTHAV